MANSTQIPADSTTSGWEPTVQDQINLALATNGGIKRIEAVMQQRLDEAGWTQNLREYVTKLLRSGEATTYDDCLAKVMAAVNAKEGANGVNGAGGAVHAPDLRMPDDAAQDSAAAVKKEISPLLVEKKDDALQQRNDSRSASSEEVVTDTAALSLAADDGEADSWYSRLLPIVHFNNGSILAASINTLVRDDTEESQRDSPQAGVAPDRTETGGLAPDVESEDADNADTELLKSAESRGSSALMAHTTSFAAESSIGQPSEKRHKAKPVYGCRTWTAQEDALLLQLMSQPATEGMAWSQLSSYFTNRTATALRKRWFILSPDSGMKTSPNGKPWTAEEDNLLVSLMEAQDSRALAWDQKAAWFENRTGSALATRWLRTLKPADAAPDPT